MKDRQRIGRIALLWLVGMMASAAPSAEPKLTRYQYDRVVMSIPIKLVLYAPDEITANGAAQAAYRRIAQLEDVLSDYEAESELSQLSNSAGEGKPTPVSSELWRVLSHSRALAEASQGAFDPTVWPLIHVWRRARRTKEMPPADKLEQARQLVGYRDLRLDPAARTAELTRRGMKLDLGGIAKGYIGDEALAVLRVHGVARAMIHAGGDIRLGERPPDKPGWVIGVGALGPKSPPSQYLSLCDCAVATSGDAFQYVEIGGKRYSHILDPRTGIGLTDQRTVTIVAPDGLTADGLSTAISVLAVEKGLKLIEATRGTAALIVCAEASGVRTWTSPGWKDLPPAKER